jgi:predicted amidohydrolase
MKLSDNITKNVEKILRYIKYADKKRIFLLCFPECALSGYITDHSKTKFESIKRGISNLQIASDKSGVSLLEGTPWYSNNSAALIRPHAAIRLYHKNNLTEYDKKYFSKGNSTLSFRTNGISCGVLICRDQNDPSLAMKYKNANILFFLSSHYYSEDEAIRKDRKNKAFPIVRAIENKIFVAIADAVGEQNGQICIGSSMVVTPQGYVIAEAERHKEEILVFSFQFLAFFEA